MSPEPQLVVLSFWDTKCQYCVQDMAVLDNVQRQVGQDKLEVIAINIHTPKRTFKKIAKQLKSYEITMLHDNRDKVSKSYGVSKGPYLAVIDVHGEVAFTYSDYSESVVNTLIPQLESLLNKPTDDLAAN